MNMKRKREKKESKLGWIGDGIELLVECGEFIFKILWFPFKMLGRGLLAVFEGLAD